MKGKKLLALALVLLMAATLLPLSVSATGEQPSAEPVNLLMNGSFDNPDLINSYWWIGAEPYRGSTCSYQFTGGVNDTGCIKMTGAGTGAQACLFYQDLVSPAPACARIVPGRTYRVSVDVFRPVGVNATIRIDIENCVTPYAETSGVGKGEWEHLSYDITPAIDGAWLRCYDLNKELLPDQYVLLDNYSIACISDAQDPIWTKPSENLLMDGCFENPNLFDLFWWVNPAEGPWRGGTCTYQAEGGRNNSGCVKMTGGTPDAAASLFYQDRVSGAPACARLVPGRWYRASVDVFRPVGVDATICFRGENVATAYAQATGEGKGEWEHLSFDLICPENVDGLWLQCFDVNKELAPSDYILIDNFSIICLTYEQAPAWSKPSENLLMNGSFNDPDLLEMYWWIGNEPFRGSTCSYQATGGVDNTGCFKMVGAGTGAQACLFYQDLVSPAPCCVRTVPGRWYRASIDVFRPVGVNATLCFRGENVVTSYAVTTGEGKGEWEHLTFDLICPDNVDGLWLQCFDLDKTLMPDQYVLLDNFSFVCVSYDQQPNWSNVSENLIRNGDFVNEAYWTADFAERYGGVDIAWLPDGGKDDSSCLQYTVNGNAGTGGLMYRFGCGWDYRVKLTANYWYSFSVDVFLEEGLDKVMAIDGENLGGHNAISTKTGEWEHLRYAFKAGATAFYDLRVFLLDNIQSAVGKTAKVDNLRVICLSAPVDPGFEPLDADDEPINLLMNGSFNDPDLLEMYWWIGNEPYRGSTCSYQPAGGVDNSGCIKMVGAGTGAQACLFYQDLVSPAPACARIRQGHTYRVSVDVFRPVGVNATIRIDVENAVNPFAETSGEGKGEWEHLSYTITPAVDGAWLRCYDLNKELLPGQYVLLDNYSIVCLSDEQQPMWSEPSANLVRNGDFVNETHWMIDYPERYGGVDIAWLPDGGVDNSACLQYTVNGNAGIGGIMYRYGSEWENRVRMIEGYWYSFSVDVFLEEGLDKVMAIDGENLSGSNAVSTKTGEWEHLRYAFKAPRTDYYDLRVFLLDNIQSAAGKTAKIDNLRVICLSAPVDPGFEPLEADVWGRNLVRTGEFENEAYTFMDWFSRDDYNGAYLTWSADGGVDNSGCAVLNTTGDSTNGCMMYHFNSPTDWGIALQAGHTYLLECDVFRPAGSTMLARLDIEGGESFGCPYTAVSKKNGEWEHIHVFFTSAATSASAPLRFLLEGDATTMAAGKTVKIDNLAVRELNGKAPIDGIYGDVTDDGKVSLTDIVRLKKYLALMDVEINEDAADVNLDDTVTVADVVRLKKYFAAYDYSTKASTVPLGF